MSLRVINNGSFDNDGSAEKIRESFQKAKENFSEQYTTIPYLDPATLAGESGKILVVNSSGTAFELAAAPGGGDLLSTNNLSDISNASQARINLGLGNSATQNSSVFATAAQGTKADSAIQSIGAGAGITIDNTNPNAPIIINNETNDYVVSGVLDYANERIRLTLQGSGTIDIAYAGVKPIIDGFTIDKNTGNTNYSAIEVGDKCSGWDGDKFIAFRVDALPYTTESNRSYAINGEIL